MNKNKVYKRNFFVEYFIRRLGAKGRFKKIIEASSPEEAVFLVFSQYQDHCDLFCVSDDNCPCYNVDMNRIRNKLSRIKRYPFFMLFDNEEKCTELSVEILSEALALAVIELSCRRKVLDEVKTFVGESFNQNYIDNYLFDFFVDKAKKWREIERRYNKYFTMFK